MRTKFLLAVTLLLLGATATQAATVTTMYTASKHPVPVYHYTCPKDIPCPAPDSVFESAYHFRSSDRRYSATVAWNCHGRTFDNRQGWVQVAEPWLMYDGPSCPASPRPGDTVIWWKNGTTSHSVTITGTWNKLSTMVMSKYGSEGQYQHALSNPIAVYGPTWAVTRFSGTIIYSGIASNDTAQEPNDTNPVIRILEEAKDKPWYETVKASELLYAVEHPRLVERSTALSESTRKQLLATEDPEEQVGLLLDDLASPSHYVALNAYNGPQFTEEFVTGIEAGKLLALLGERFPEVKPMIVDRLATVAKASETPDPTRGAAIHFLGTIDPEQVRVLKDELEQKRTTTEKTPYTSYSEYYLIKSAPKDN